MSTRSYQPKRYRWRIPKTFIGVTVVAIAVFYGIHWAGRNGPEGNHSVNPPLPTSTRSKAPKQETFQMPASYLIHVPAKDQYPQLPNGCEVTSLAMLMTAVGHPVSKMTLASQMPVDPTKVSLTTVTGSNGKPINKVVYWGNPNVGFVGSVYQAGNGYGIYHGPMTKFLNQLLPGRAEDLTGQNFSSVLRHVAHGIPVEVWTTTTFHPTADWVTWNSPEGPVHATPLEHAVLVVGYSPGYVYINNPLNGQAAQKVAKAPFVASWKQLGQQAITVKPTS